MTLGSVLIATVAAYSKLIGSRLYLLATIFVFERSTTVVYGAGVRNSFYSGDVR